VRPQVLGPATPHHLEPFLEDEPVARLDLGPVTPGDSDPEVLAEHAHRPGLVTAGQPDIEPAAGQVIGHRDVFGQPQRVPVRQHQAHLPVPQPGSVLG
jgi:hypothetical protein